MNVKRLGMRMTMVLAATGAAAMVAACQQGENGQPAVTVTEQAPPPTDTGGTARAAAGELPPSWPDQDFPLPPSVTVTEATSGDTTGIVLTGTDPQEVIDFYRDALPAAGYEIEADAGVDVGGTTIAGLRFSGNGYSGKIAVTAGTVTIKLEDTGGDVGGDPGDGDTGSGAGLPNSWPDQSFPLPAGVTVTVDGSTGDERGIILRGVNGDTVLDFYRDALPAAGYTVTKDEGVDVGGISVTELEFTGHGWDGEIAIVAGQRNMVAISLERA